MKMFAPLALAVAAGLSSGSAGAQTPVITATTVEPAADADAYANLIGLFDDPALQLEMIRRMAEGFGRHLVASNPTANDLAARHPPLAREVAQAVQPIFSAHSARVRLAYLPRMEAALREVFEPAEAKSLLEFYGSAIGQRLLRSYAVRDDGTDRVRDVTTTGRISQDAIAADFARNSANAIGAVGQEELAHAAMRYPALAKMGQYQALVLPIRTEMENAPLSPEHETALRAAIRDRLRSAAR